MLRSTLLRTAAVPGLMLSLALVLGHRQAIQACEGCGYRTACDTGCGHQSAGDTCGSAESYWCGLAAPSYPVPYDTPTWVGRTELTYPPLMPHNSLPHYRHVYSFRHGPGLSRTNVIWHQSYLHNALKRVHYALKLAR